MLHTALRSLWATPHNQRHWNFCSLLCSLPGGEEIKTKSFKSAKLPEGSFLLPKWGQVRSYFATKFARKKTKKILKWTKWGLERVDHLPEVLRSRDSNQGGVTLKPTLQMSGLWSCPPDPPSLILPLTAGPPHPGLGAADVTTALSIWVLMAVHVPHFWVSKGRRFVPAAMLFQSLGQGSTSVSICWIWLKALPRNPGEKVILGLWEVLRL